MTWDINNIKSKVRSLTARYSATDLTDADLENRINQFYRYRLISQLKPEELNHSYLLQTILYHSIYPIDTDAYTAIHAPLLMLQGDQVLRFYTDPILFNRENPIPTDYMKFTIPKEASYEVRIILPPSTALDPSTLRVSVNEITYMPMNTDWNNGFARLVNVVNNHIGTINYKTGIITLDNPDVNSEADKVEIEVNFSVLVLSRPHAALYFNDNLTLFPTPDRAYTIQMRVSSRPKSLSASNSMPLNIAWGPAIAYGAAYEIFIDNGQMDSAERMKALYNNEYQVIMAHSTERAQDQQTPPRF